MSTYKLNTDRLIFTGNASGIDGDIHIESSDINNKIVFPNRIETTQLTAPKIKTNVIFNQEDEEVMSIIGDNIVLNKPIDFNNMALLNMGSYDLYSNQIFSSNLAGQAAPNNTLDKELDNLTVSVNNNTSRTTGLTTNKIIRSNNSGTIQVGNHDETDFIRNNTAVQQNLLGDLHFPSGKGIKYDGADLTHRALSGWTITQDEIDLNTAKISVTSQNLSDITANNAKVGVTSQNLTDITGNNAKVGITTQNLSDITDNNAKVGITSQNLSDISDNNDKTGITSTQSANIVTNNGKTGITSTQASNIITNNGKTGITSTQASDIIANNAKITFSGTNLTELQNATSNISTLTSDLSTLNQDVGFVDALKVNKSTPTFSGLSNGLCLITGNVLSGGHSLVASDIPSIPATKINTQLSVAQIPNLDGSKIVSLLDSSVIPNLPATKITSGVINISRIPSLPISKINDFTPIQNAIDANTNKITFSSSNLTELQNATSNISTLTSDLSTTNQDVGFLDILKVNKSNPTFSGLSNGICRITGNVLSAGTLTSSDIPNISATKLSQGFLDDDRLTSNIMRLDTDQTVTGLNSYSQGVVAGSFSSGVYSSLNNIGSISLQNTTTATRTRIHYNYLTTNISVGDNANGDLEQEDGNYNIANGNLLIGGSQIALANLSDGANVLKSGVQQGSINCNGDFHIRDATTNGAIISYEQANNNTFFTGTNIYMLDASGNTTLSVSLSNTNPNIIINNSSEISRGSVGVFTNIASIKANITALQGLSSSYVDLSSSETIGGTKQFSNQINVIDSGNQDNMSILHNDGRLYMRNVDNGSSFVQMITNTTSVKLSCDVASLSLLCDRDINLQTGRTYKINGTQISSSSLSDSSNIIKQNQSGINFTNAVQFSGSSIGVVSNGFNNSILSNDGKLELNNNTSNSNIRLTSTAHTVNISSDNITQSLKVDNDININQGKQYKIDNAQISSVNLSDYSQLMRKPNIWTQSNTGQILIKTTFDSNNNILFQQTDLFNNTFTNVNESLPLGFYTVKIDMIPSASSQSGIYQFMGTAPIHFTNTTNDSDSTPEIKLNLTSFHHASQHGLPALYLVPKSSNAWEVYLIWDSIDSTRTNDTFNCRIAIREEYWG